MLGELVSTAPLTIVPISKVETARRAYSPTPWGPNLSKQILHASFLVDIVSKHVLRGADSLESIQALWLEITQALQAGWRTGAGILILLHIKDCKEEKLVVMVITK